MSPEPSETLKEAQRLQAFGWMSPAAKMIKIFMEDQYKNMGPEGEKNG